MTSIQIEFFAQLEAVAQQPVKQLTLNRDETLGDFIKRACREDTEALSRLILDAEERIHPWIMVSLNNAVVRDLEMIAIKEGDVIRLMPAISGG